jgi:lipid-A-disaccharide synthase
MDKEVVKELIQGDFTEEKLRAELDRLINDKSYRSEMLQNLDALHEKLGGPGASEKTAQLMYDRLSV